MTPQRYPLTIADDHWDVGSAGELAIALDVLQGRHDRAVLEQLAPHLAEIMANAAGLMAILRALASRTPRGTLYTPLEAPRLRSGRCRVRLSGVPHTPPGPRQSLACL